jgi:hypothetical protein
MKPHYFFSFGTDRLIALITDKEFEVSKLGLNYSNSMLQLICWRRDIEISTAICAEIF